MNKNLTAHHTSHLSEKYQTVHFLEQQETFWSSKYLILTNNKNEVLKSNSIQISKISSRKRTNQILQSQKPYQSIGETHTACGKKKQFQELRVRIQ